MITCLRYLNSMSDIANKKYTIMYQSNRNLDILPPRAYPGHLTPFLAREGGHLIATHRGGEFDRKPRFHVTRRADSTWVDKSWRRRRRQTLMNSKEKIAYSWRIGRKLKAYTNFVLYLKVFSTDLYLSLNM